MLDAIFVASNVGIFLGYVVLSLVIAPRLDVELLTTRIGGAVFFMTCGLTHLHLLADGSHLATVTGMLVHLIQVVAVWATIFGLHAEFVRKR